MERSIKALTALFVLALLAFTTDTEPTASSIIKKAEDKLRGAQTTAEIAITIQRPKWSRTMNLKTWSKGTAYSMTLVTAPARDQGTVFLKKGREVWNWIPSVERTIKLPPSMMSQSWMGTDLTNDDLVRESSMVKDFTHTLLGKDTLNGRPCYKIKSVAKEDAAVVWGKIVSWIDTKDYIQLKTRFYDEDDELVNTFTASNIRMMGGKMIASKMVILPADKKGQKTILEYKSLDFKTPISDDFFTVQNMKKIK
ncbi:MAG: outer membrane lipoprotein-sorting protein [Bacteroidia bacterium]|nr:outer membrane lipoprotein-sorting protein [Bacteroidia bacterium]